MKKENKRDKSNQEDVFYDQSWYLHFNRFLFLRLLWYIDFGGMKQAFINSFSTWLFYYIFILERKTKKWRNLNENVLFVSTGVQLMTP